MDSLTLYVVVPVLALSAALATYRVVRGPSLPDRVVALDLLGSISIAVIAAYALAVDEPLFVDVALIVALIGFLGTVAFARYIERSV